MRQDATPGAGDRQGAEAGRFTRIAAPRWDPAATPTRARFPEDTFRIALSVLVYRGGPPRRSAAGKRRSPWSLGCRRSAPNVFAQTDADTTDYRFPVCVADTISAANLDLSVKFKPVSGNGDQAGGLVWRYKDANNYYIVRANARENNVVLYKVENGRRISLAPKGTAAGTYGMKEPVPSGQWSTLRVVANGSLFEVYFNGKHLYDVDDATFKDAGKIGVWTKADSVTYFDDLQVTTK
jgi:hypothetical protein